MKRSLAKRLNAILLSVSGVALVVTCLALAAFDFRAQQRALHAELTSVVSLLAASTGAALLFNDPAAATELLQATQRLPHIRAAVLFDADGRPFAVYRRGAVSLPSRPGAAGRFDWRAGQFDIGAPVQMNADTLGSITIRASLEPLYARMTQYGIAILVVLACSFLLVWWLSRKLIGKVTQPVMTLSAVAHEVTTRGTYALRAPPGSDDEVGVLIGTFNRMLAAIEQRDQELEQHRDHLSEMIESRTAQLKAVNAALGTSKELAENSARQLAEIAYRDPLTGLPNRSLLNDRLSQLIERSRRISGRFALLFLDLDRFKIINDTLGHGVGDALLVEVAARLRRALREEDTIARLGGDEFMVLLPDLHQADHAARLAAKLIETVSETIHCDGHELHVTASIGIALYPEDGVDGTTLIKHADTGMYRAKEQGRNSYAFFTEEINNQSERRLTIENHMRRAMERGEFTLYYQPIVSSDDGKIQSVEALLRWHQPDLGEIKPVEFIPIAEDSGLIVPIGEWVLHEACRQAVAWQDAGCLPVSVAVNLSARQLHGKLLLKAVTAALAESGIAPQLLALEITETMAMQNMDAVSLTLHALREMGIQTSVDDFGTGHSSLAYLKRLPIHILKIDRSFVRDIPQDEDDMAISAAIIAMAHRLKLRVVAEGVESVEQRDFLRLQGCDFMQGFLFSTPLPADRIMTLLPRAALQSHPAAARRR